jgi:hypothetical protein
MALDRYGKLCDFAKNKMHVAFSEGRQQTK